MSDIEPLTATSLAARLRSRDLTATEVVEDCLERIISRDSDIHAWTAVDAGYAREQARTLDAGPIRGPLHGIPIAVKDIIDTATLPTEYGSPIYAGHTSASDAACVSAARAAGAIVLGKTATTEFAYLSPTATVNPHNFSHTPGGSSSGSAAAVADNMVPLAFGTQTAGSVIRPASYCGVVGYKPTYGVIDRAGVKLIAESLDTVGVLAHTVSDAALFAGAIASIPDLGGHQSWTGEVQARFCRTHNWSEVDPDVRRIIESVAAQLTVAGARISEQDLPDQFAELDHAHAAIQGFEAARNLKFELHEHRSRLSPILLAMLEEGADISKVRYTKSLNLVRECRAALSSVFGDCQVLITASTTSQAPIGLETTGSPTMNRSWTALHAPCVSIPANRRSGDLPVGVQIIGRPSDDARVLAVAGWVEQQLEGIDAGAII